VSTDVEEGRTLEGNSQATGHRDSTGQRDTTLTQIHFTSHTVIETEKGKKERKGPGSKSQPGLGKSLYVRGSRDREDPPPPITAYPRDTPTHTHLRAGSGSQPICPVCFHPWGSSSHSFGPSFRMRDRGSFSLSYKRRQVYQDRRGRTSGRHGGGGG
jgi:hypothetical protein